MPEADFRCPPETSTETNIKELVDLPGIYDPLPVRRKGL